MSKQANDCISNVVKSFNHILRNTIRIGNQNQNFRIFTGDTSALIIIVQVIFCFLLDHWAHPGYFENRIPLKSALGGVCRLANYSVVYEETQSNRVSDFRDFFFFFFFFKSNPFLLLFYSTVADVVPCGGRKVSPYIIIMQVIFYFLWDHLAHPGYFENRIRLSRR